MSLLEFCQKLTHKNDLLLIYSFSDFWNNVYIKIAQGGLFEGVVTA